MPLRDRGQGLWSLQDSKAGSGRESPEQQKTNAFLKFRKKVPYESLKEAPEISFSVGLERSHF